MRGGKRSISVFRAGLLAIVVIGVLSFFGFTKANPFANPYVLKGVFDNANNLKPRSPVRIAGVEIGKVTKVEPISSGEGAARVTMEIKKKGLPIHSDATLKIRPRIFLEGNFFVDIQPGTPSTGALETDSTIPIGQTAAPVQFGDLLAALQSDTREDLQVFLDEYSKGLEGEGARGFNESIKYWEPAYKNTALANDATLGQEPTRDLQRVLKGQQKTFAALNSNPEVLKDLITNFNITAGAFAREDVALEASIPALRDTLRAAQPALASVNAALPTLRVFSREALPGVRSSNATLRESLPFITQVRRLMSRRELRGAAAQLRRAIPNLARFNRRSIPLLAQTRALSACTNNVLVPFVNLRIPNMEEPGNNNQQVRQQIQRGFPGLAGESRQSDGNANGYFHSSAVAPGNRVRPGTPPDGGNTPPPHRPDVPCEEQELPNLRAPGGPTTSFPILENSAGAQRWDEDRQVGGKEIMRTLRTVRRSWREYKRDPNEYWRKSDAEAEKRKKAEDEAEKDKKVSAR